MGGLLIVFEGKDKTGKTTQSQLLVKKLNEMNIKAEYIPFPNRTTEIGKLIDKYLKKELDYSPETIHLLFSANRREMQKHIHTALQNNIHVVLDRYYVSGQVYSAVLGVDIKADIGIIKPNITFYLNYIYNSANYKEKYESEEFQNSLNFRQFLDSSWIEYNIKTDIDTLHHQILNEVLFQIKYFNDFSIQYVK